MKKQSEDKKTLQLAESILHEYFTYEKFTPSQEKCIVNIMRRRDVMAILPTGAGKSLCFQIPALVFEGLTIVVTPLVSLMHDQVARLDMEGGTANRGGLRKSIPAEYIDSAKEDKKQVLIRAAQGKYKLLYVAPERLQSLRFIEFAKKAKIDFIAVDEAHCISMWGYDFRPLYLEIIRFVHCLERRPVIGAFTATATREVVDDIVRLLEMDSGTKKRGYCLVREGIKRENLIFSVKRVRGKKNKKNELINYLESHK